MHGRPLIGNEIRLLEHVQESSRQVDRFGLPASYKLSKATLSERPFVAISYCWGSTNSPASASINDVRFKITRSVLSILGILAAKPQSRGTAPELNAANLLRKKPLWIDAICINQSDETEVQSQMSMMREVYRSARHTMVYMGQPQYGNKSAKSAFDWLRDITDQPFQTFYDTPKELRLLNWSSGSWALVVELLEQPWFRRRWIIQEAAVSADVWMVYGAEILHWDRFADAIERCALMWSDIAHKPGFQMQTTEPMADPTPTMSIQKLRTRIANESKPIQVFEILLRFRQSDCGFPSERLFAVLGLGTKAERESNKIDLKLDPAETFRRFVLSYIKLNEDLNILCVALEIARMQRPSFRFIKDGLWIDPDPKKYGKMVYLPDLPTWVPNFTSFRVEWLLGPTPGLIREEFNPIFDAARGCPPLVLALNTSNIGRILPVDGIEIDRIADVHPESPIAHPAYQTADSPFWQSYWSWTCAGSLVPRSYPTYESRWVAFLRALGAGSRCSNTDRILSDEYVKHYAMQFFNERPLKEIWQREGLVASLPNDASTWYTPPKPDADPEYTPGIEYNKLCYFRLVRGDSGRIGLAPPHTKVGDRIVVVFGCSSPLLLEPCSARQDHYSTKGEAYMHGYMFGEAVALWRQGRLHARRFNLI